MEYSEDEKLLMDYLDGSLEAAGVQELQKRLLRETKLKQKLALYKWGMQTVRVEAIRNLVAQSQHDFLKTRDKDSQVVEKHEPTGIRFTPSFAQWVGIAASILVFVALGGVLYLGNMSGADLYQDKFLSYEISSFRGNAENASGIQDLYRSGDFAAALAVVSPEGDLESISKDELLLLGVASLETDKPQQAITYLNVLQKRNALDQSGELQDERDFYAALAYVQMNNYTEGYALMVDITQDSAHKYNKNFPLGYRTKIKILSLIK